MARRPKRKVARIERTRLPVLAQPGNQGLLRQAVLYLRGEKWPQAFELAQHALDTATRPEEQVAARQLMAEVIFRSACQTREPARRLEYLDEALARLPGEARLRFHRAVALWQLARLPEALAELDAVAASEPERPGLSFLRCLARSGLTERPPPCPGPLTPAEANTLRWIEQLRQGQTPDPATARVEMVGHVADLWQALGEMYRRPDAAPLDVLDRAQRRGGGNTVRSIARYYRGVAALRAGDRRTALAAWHAAREPGFATPWADANRQALLRETGAALAGAGEWSAVVALLGQAPHPLTDVTLAATIALGFDHLGYAASQRGDWEEAAGNWEQANALAPTRQRAQNLALTAEAMEHWSAAGDAWREMVRRRPRKPDHPDYLTDRQVAAIWAHAAACYREDGDGTQEIVCLRTALKYAADDGALRLQLVDALLNNDQIEAGVNALIRILDDDPRDVEALIRLGTLELDGWGDAVTTWRRALAIDPRNPRIRDGLAAAHVEELGDSGAPWTRNRERAIQAALSDLPDHPRVLIAVARLRRALRQVEQARDLLQRACDAAPGDSRVAGEVLHEYVHLSAETEAAALIDDLRRSPSLLPLFWVDQGQKVLRCHLGAAWATRLFDEGVTLAAAGDRQFTPADTLIHIVDAIYDAHGGADLMAHYADRITREVPDSGAVEYVAAHRARYDADDRREAERQLREAIRKARRANEPGVTKAAEAELAKLQAPPPGPDLLRRFLARYPAAPRNLRELQDMLDAFNEDPD